MPSTKFPRVGFISFLPRMRLWLAAHTLRRKRKEAEGHSAHRHRGPERRKALRRANGNVTRRLPLCRDIESTDILVMKAFAQNKLPRLLSSRGDSSIVMYILNNVLKICTKMTFETAQSIPTLSDNKRRVWELVLLGNRSALLIFAHADERNVKLFGWR